MFSEKPIGISLAVLVQCAKISAVYSLGLHVVVSLVKLTNYVCILPNGWVKFVGKILKEIQITGVL